MEYKKRKRLIKLATGEENSFWRFKRGKAWMLAFTASILLAILAGVFMYSVGTKKDMQDQALEPNQTLDIEPQTFPNLSPTQELDITKYKIEVLNGSGVQGEAARARTLLEGEGFSVISIGNSDPPKYTKTVIQIKEGTPEFFILKLKSTLDKTYIVAKEASELPSGEIDVVVIIGKDRRDAEN